MFPEIDKRQLGRRLKNILMEKKITARDVQEYLSLSCVQTVYRWIEGINIPCIDHLYALSVLMDVSMDYLVDGGQKKGSEIFYQKIVYGDVFIFRMTVPPKNKDGYKLCKSYLLIKNRKGGIAEKRIIGYVKKTGNSCGSEHMKDAYQNTGRTLTLS